MCVNYTSLLGLVGKEMALRSFALVLFLCCLDLTIARSCNYLMNSTNCSPCCSDGVCRTTCCSYDSQCGTGEECCTGYCTTSCSNGPNAGLLSGLVVGTIVFAVIIALAAFFRCKSSPCYRYWHRSEFEGRMIAGGHVPAQPMETTATTGQITQVQLPIAVANNPTLPAGFNEPPPPYTVAYSKSPAAVVNQ